LFIGVSILPITSSMNNNELNEDFNQCNEQFNSSVRKLYFLGRIQNLTVQGNDYEFKSNNMRKFTYWRSGIRSWGVSYDHFVGAYSCHISGFNFRGILRPNFICGVFYT